MSHLSSCKRSTSSARWSGLINQKSVLIVFETVDIDTATRWLDDPVLFHAEARVQSVLNATIKCAGAGGEDFDDDIRRAFDAALADEAFLVFSDDAEIWLKDVGV